MDLSMQFSTYFWTYILILIFFYLAVEDHKRKEKKLENKISALRECELTHIDIINRKDKEISILRKKNEKLKFQIAHPAKYKIGEAIKLPNTQFTIVRIKCIENHPIIFAARALAFIFEHGMDKAKEKRDELPRGTHYYEYHSVSGEKFTESFIEQNKIE